MKRGEIHEGIPYRRARSVLKLSKIVKDLERINKIKTELRKGNERYYDEYIKPEYRCRCDEYPNSC